MQAHEPIAITGIGCRFPGGGNGPKAFWNLLRDGVDAVGEIPPDRWNIGKFYDPEQGLPGKSYSRWGGFVKGIDQFDAPFFGISPREAAYMDPQQRMLLEVAWESLEDAGQVVDVDAGSNTGVFVGISTHDYSQIQATPNDKNTIDVHTTTGGVLSIAANRISYLFNFRGPSFAVDTACSSSLVAVHLACRSLWNGECTTALAAGVNAILIADTYIGFSKMSMLSPQGRCRAFDAKGDGFVRGEGAGVIVLKPLSAARAAGDRIYAVIRGSAINQDGRTSSLTVPSSEAQERLILDACRDAEISPSEIDYVEAHGTGTSVGDPIETSAIGAALGQERNGKQCVIGSVKTNIGHLEAGSGIAGIIKVALALKHGEVPGNLHFEEPNPNINFEAWKLRVPRAVEKLPRADALAGINSFGFGGTNAHVILQGVEQPSIEVEAAGPCLFTLSARDQESLGGMAREYSQWLAGNPGQLRDICHTLAARRGHHEHRLAVVAESAPEVIEKLDAFLAGEARAGLAAASGATRRKLAFVFTGQGPQWWAMGRELLTANKVFREKIEECDALFRQHGKWSLIEELMRDEATSNMAQTAIAQPSIFALQVALAAWWHDHGVDPDAIIGHSVGEAASAYFSGALDLPTAAKVIFHRGRCMQLVPPTGRMLAVALSPDEAQPWIAGYAGRAEIGAVNSPRSITLSGEPAALEEIAHKLENEKIWCRFLRVNYAFHSVQMEPIQAELKASLKGIECRPVTLPVCSTVVGKFFDSGKFDAEYWWHNVRNPVQFAAGIGVLIESGYTTFLEIGPHPALTGSISECLKARPAEGLVVGSLRRNEPESRTLLGSLGQLHVNGQPFRLPETGRCVSLPLYHWRHESYWHEAEESKTTRLEGPRHPLLGRSMNTARPAWELKIEKALLPYLDHHRVNGRVVFPAAAYVEMALGAGAETHGKPGVLLEDVEFQRAFFLPESERSVRMQFEYDAEEGLFHISSQADHAEGSWTAHSRGKLRAMVNPRVPQAPALDEIKQRCNEEKSGGDSYDLFRESGLDFGASFRGVSRVWRRNGEALGEIHAPDILDPKGYQIHPALLDSCFQVLLATLPVKQARCLYLPVRIDRLRFYAKSGTRIWSHVTLTETSERSIVANFELLDEQGNIFAQLEGFRCAAIEQARAESQELGDCFYNIQWHEQALGPQPAGALQGGWWIIGADRHLASAVAAGLKSKGEKSSVIAGVENMDGQLRKGPKPGGVIYLAAPQGGDAAMAALEICSELLRLVQSLTASTAAPKLVIVTREAQPVRMGEGPQAVAMGSLAGLGRVVMNEHQELRCRLVDLSAAPSSAEVEAFVDELCEGGDEEVVLRGNSRLVPRLTRETIKPKAADGSVTPFRLEVTKPGVFENVEFRAAGRTAPKAGEIEIEVCAAGLNFRDVMKVLGIYPIEQPIDHMLGDECAGRVIAVGEGVTGLKVGDEVVAIAPACFTKYLTVNSAFAVKKPARLSFEDAVTIPVTFLTAQYALHHLGRLARGERVLVHAAAGGVGIAALQIAKAAGAEIFATAGNDEKRALARSFGAAHVMDSRSLDFADEVNAITQGKGVDLVLNSLAGEAIPKSLAILAPYGRFLEIGKRDIYQDSRLGLRPFRKNLSFFAIDLSQLLRDKPLFISAMLKELMAQFEKGELSPLPKTVFPISSAAEAFRMMAQARHVGKIVFSFADANVQVQPSQPGQMTFREDATYLVTGGTRGFGLAIAGWMIENGARNLVVVGATAASAASAQKHFGALKGGSVRVLAKAVDISDASALKALLSQICETMPPLRGVVHAAVKMDDGILKQLDATRLLNVMGPKAAGAWNLHVQTLGLPLDFFVMFSSISSMVGNPGQGNYAAANAFLDALAHHRHAHGLPALTVNWGHIGGVGYASRHANVSEHLNRHGMAALDSQEAAAVLGRLVQSDIPQVTAARIDWERWAETNPRQRNSARYSEFASVQASDQPGQEQGADAAASILRASGETRVELLEGFIQEQAARVLGTSAARLDINRPLNDLGLDSLMGIELINRIEDGLGVPFPTGKLMGAPSIATLATILNESIENENEGKAPESNATEKEAELASLK